MTPFAAQPAQESALEDLSVEPIGLGSPMLARHCDARGMNDVGFNAMRLQPASQPEAIAPRLLGDGDALNLTTRPDRLLLPTRQELPKCLRIRPKLLQGWRLMPGTIPAASQLV